MKFHNLGSATLIATALVLSGCGSNDDDSDILDPMTPTNTPDAPGEGVDSPGTPSGPLPGDGPVAPAQASLELVADKTFRISWMASVGADSYRILENPDGVSGFSPVATDLDASTRSFDHRVALYRRIGARYIVQACNADGCADSTELVASGTLEGAVGYFKADSVGSGFGGSVSLSSDGTTLAVVAEGSRVHVFVRGEGTWEQQTTVNSGDAVSTVVSLSADGNTLAIGASEDGSDATGIDGDQDDDTASRSGAVFVFVRRDGNWQQQAYVKAGNTGRDDLFGEAVSLSADGDTLAVGASREDSAATGVGGDGVDDSAEDSGAVYVFTRADGNWQQQAYVKASNTSQANELGVVGNFSLTGDGFGTAVSLSADGNTLAVGARFEDSAATGGGGDQADNSQGSSGAVYLFARSDGGWQQQDYLKASNTGSPDFFGGAVALSAGGDTLAVGAVGEDSVATGTDGNQDDDSAGDSGAVYVFARSDGSWRQQAYLKASNTGPNDIFGLVVSIDANGDTLAVGTNQENSSARGLEGDQSDNSDYRASSIAAGAVYVFTRSDGDWRQLAYLKASNTDPADVTCALDLGDRIEQVSGDAFGGAVSLSGDGNTLAVGATRECSAATGVNGDQEDNSVFGTGAVYLY